MDRRQKKSREAIFKSFSALLAKKSYGNITVGQIIERADVGRATFYAHFETKDHLLKELCPELFCHVFDATVQGKSEHMHIFECEAPDSVILHLLMHLQRNDNGILDLLSCENNELFLRYFKDDLKKLLLKQDNVFKNRYGDRLPDAYWTDFVASAFVETVRWWINGKMNESAETICSYFMTVVG